MSLRVSDEDANLIREEVSSSETPADLASIKLPGEFEQGYSVSVNALRNVQEQGDSVMNDANSVLSKNGSVTNLPSNEPHTSSAANNTVADMQRNRSAASKGIEQQKRSNLTTSTSNNV